jgi:hypothetical protein
MSASEQQKDIAGYLEKLYRSRTPRPQAEKKILGSGKKIGGFQARLEKIKASPGKIFNPVPTPAVVVKC